MASNRIRSTQAWRKLAKQAIREEPICWLNLDGCTRRSTTADHIIPISQHPELALTRTNVRGACRNCNSKRGNLPIGSWQTHNTTPRGTDNNAGHSGAPRALSFFE